MAENPLLPNAELQALHALLKRSAKAAKGTANTRKPRQTGPKPKGRPHQAPAAGHEALLAATLLQLRPGDLLVAESGDPLPATLLPANDRATNEAQPGHPDLPPNTPQLLLAAAMAAAVRSSGKDRLVLALARTGIADPSWQGALTWAQEQLLPLIVAIADPSGPNVFRGPARSTPGTLTWTSLGSLTRRLQLPVLSVDGEDAVAVYRVMQESALRARTGGGPAILWATLPTPKERLAERPEAASPLRRLERYLRTRSIPF